MHIKFEKSNKKILEAKACLMVFSSFTADTDVHRPVINVWAEYVHFPFTSTKS